MSSDKQTPNPESEAFDAVIKAIVDATLALDTALGHMEDARFAPANVSVRDAVAMRAAENAIARGTETLGWLTAWSRRVRSNRAARERKEGTR
jgi:hypothetical protein